MSTARYDGYADWYDDTFAGYGDLGSESSSGAAIARLLDPGQGWCLDVACGTGLHFAAIESTGRRVFGVDISGDQLRHARRRAAAVALANASKLPFDAGTFPTAVCAYLHTDTPDMPAVFAEIARVLEPGGRLVYLGVHPCFRGHFVEYGPDRRTLHEGYWDAGWHTTSPHRRYTAIRERVGAHHITLADLLNAAVTSGLRITNVEEGDRSQPFPDRIAITATKD